MLRKLISMLKRKRGTRVQLEGWLMGYWIRPDGERVPWWRTPVHNIITNCYLARTAYFMGFTEASPYLYGAVGTGTNDPAVTDTALQTEVNRVLGTPSIQTTSSPNDTYQLVSEHTAPGGGWNLTEYGNFDAAAAGVIGCRVEFAAVNVAEGNKFQMTYKCQVQRV